MNSLFSVAGVQTRAISLSEGISAIASSFLCVPMMRSIQAEFLLPSKDAAGRLKDVSGGAATSFIRIPRA
tara:strand:- start:2059 stop:2268 length:210 start_codon:yes stop_codon:yes gene_type:complete